MPPAPLHSLHSPHSLHSLHSLLAVAPLLLLGACTAPDRATAPRAATAPITAVASVPGPPAAIGADGLPSATTTVSTRLTRALLERVSAGLLYTSESDYPFTYVGAAGPAPTPLTVDAVRQAFAIAPDTPIETIDLDAFFARHIERVDPADAAAVALVPRYRLLRETLRATLRQPRVYRVGRIAITCYVVGTDWSGQIAGLSTVAIET